MTSLSFASILLISLLIIEKLLLEPIDLIASVHLPYSVTIATVLLLLSWLMREA
jgi:hypothetical protein